MRDGEVVAISKFKATCLELLKRVQQTGQPLIVTRLGEPIAKIVPPDQPSLLEWLGSGRNTGEITGDIISPLDINIWESL